MEEDKTEKALEIIGETCWEGDMNVVKHQRLELYNLAGVGVGVGVLNNTNKITNDDGEKWPTATDEHASYSSLVGSCGF